MNLQKRKSNRLKDYDYSQYGYYFVTICTYKKRHYLSKMGVGQGLAPAENILTEYGKIVREQLLDLENRFSNIKLNKFVIMPNHIHMIIEIDEMKAAGASPCPTLSDVICAFKSITTLKCKQLYPIEKVFQNSFYDHIIRGENDYQKIWNYIDTNPQKWQEDRFYN